MANNGIVNSLTFTGAVVGTSTIQAQSVAGNLTFLLPNQLPVAGQLLSAQSLSGNVITMGWSAPSSAPSFSQITGSLALSQIGQGGATTGQVLYWNGTTWAPETLSGAGTVTSVALTAPAIFTVSGSPITAAGTLALTLATQSANTVWAGPITGAAAAPSFRALVVADIPSLPYLSSSTVLAANTPAVSNEFLTSYNSSTGAFTQAAASFTGLTGSIATGQIPASTITLAQINSKAGNGSAVQLTNVETSTAGDVVTYDANANVQDSGVLLSSLATQSFVTGQGYITSSALSPYALLAGATFTGDITTTSGSLFIHGNNNGESICQIFTGSAGTPASTEVIAIDVNGNLQFLIAGIIDNSASSGTSGQVLTAGTGGKVVWATPSAGAPGGSSGQIQWNNSGVFAGVTGTTATATGISAIAADTTSGLTISATGANAIVLQTGTGSFSFFGNGGGMTLATANASVAIDSSGDVSLSASSSTPGANIIITPNASGLINIAGTIQFNHKVEDVNGQGGGVNEFLSSNGGSSNVLWSTIASTQLSDTASLAYLAGATFTGTVIAPNVSVSSHLNTNADLAGTVTITNPSATGGVTFTTPFAGTNAPIVTVAALATDPTPLGGVWITYQGSAGAWTGFTINVTTPPASTVNFNYMVMGNPN